jgi:hypothetical protein
MSGTVHLQLYQPYPTYNLTLEVIGKEKTKWVDKDKHSGENAILFIRHPLHTFANSVAQPG